jgi:hypothetical protein
MHFNDTFRALFLNLEDWVVRGTQPPANQVPKLADGTLVRPEALAFPAMKGLAWAVGGVQTPIPDFSYRGLYNNFPLFDFGPQYLPQDESGIATLLPPRNLGRDYAILVPQVDASTGLTRAGIRSVEARAPLGTSIEFNYVATPGFIPFHKTRAARLAAGDARPSLEELYGTQEGYVAAVTEAANTLVAQRLLLQRDADLQIARAKAAAVLP